MVNHKNFVLLGELIGKNLGESAKSRLVYKLLNYVNTEDRDAFINEILRELALIEKRGNDYYEVLEFLKNSISEIYDNNFKKIAHIIILGILGGEKNE
ncbi:MAG: hypothetical protein QXR30_01470 [Candidatus Woesearchaeota archaeon]